jgi:hypothetical protein
MRPPLSSSAAASVEASGADVAERPNMLNFVVDWSSLTNASAS